MQQNRRDRIHQLVDQRRDWSASSDIGCVEVWFLRAVLEEFAPDVLAEFDTAWKRPGEFWDEREAEHRKKSADKAAWDLGLVLFADRHSRQTPAEREAEWERDQAELSMSELERKYGL